MDSLKETLMEFVTETPVVESTGDILATVGGVVSDTVPVAETGQNTLSCLKTHLSPCIARNELSPTREGLFKSILAQDDSNANNREIKVHLIIVSHAI